jgi:hypothetical protein
MRAISLLLGLTVAAAIAVSVAFPFGPLRLLAGSPGGAPPAPGSPGAPPVVFAAPDQDAADTTTVSRQRSARLLATRVSSLEATLVPLEGRVTDLEATVDALSSSRNTRPVATRTPVPRQERAGRRVRVSGTGVDVSEKFHLDARRYRVTASMTVSDFDGFSCELFGPNGFDDLIFNEIIDSPQQWSAQTVVDITTAGDYFIGVSNTDGRWTLLFAPY